MADWPLIEGQDAEAIGSVGAGSDGTTVTSGAANTKGSYVQLIASTAFDIHYISIQLYPVGEATGDALLCDIAVGAASSEYDIIPNLYCESATASFRTPVAQYSFPIFIPAGSRISARCQADAATQAVDINLQGFGFSFMPSAPLTSLIEAMGFDLSDSAGTLVDPGGSANTKGAWSQLVASTAREIRALGLAVGRNAGNQSLSDADFLVDIGVGAAGSERVIIPDWYAFSGSSGDTYRSQGTPAFPVYIPAGSRVAARAQSSDTDATDRLIDVIAYGAS